MKNSRDLKTLGRPGELSGAWSFLPYEEGNEIPRREIQILRALHGLMVPLVDLITITAGIFIGYLLVDGMVNRGMWSSVFGQQTGMITSSALSAGLVTIPLWLLVFAYYGVYRREVTRLSISTFDELQQTVGALAVGAWLEISYLQVFGHDAVNGRAVWLYVALTLLVLIFLLPFGRAVARISLSFLNPFRTSTLIVGSGEVGRSLIGRLARHKEYGLRVVGFLDTAIVDKPDGEEGVERASVQLLGRPSELRSIIEHYGISRVIIAFTRTPHPLILGIIHECQEMRVDVSIVPRFFEALSPHTEIEDVEGLPILSLPRYSRHRSLARMIKRLIDIVGTILIVTMLSPLLLLVALLIKLDSAGPVFFKQERMGKDHKNFLVYKFRSMDTGAHRKQEELAGQNQASGPIFKMKEDPRVTRVGRVIRRLSIDELPQLINVFKGQMSLVGPRPLPVEEAESCTGTADMRHLVQPGITGLWQILGRSDIPFEEMVQLDYLYVTNWTLKGDIKIILRTVLAIVRKRGAY
ncbi:MAG: sugar transferase [Actinobacteria bacterium]|nr:sugar transferase [Actinomycetota bacterium]MCL5882528.1 sugar transferase [Actinomycetota bacterium]